MTPKRRENLRLGVFYPDRIKNIRMEKSMDINLFIVIILLGGWFMGRFFNKLKLPSVLGMLIWGISFAFFFPGKIPESIETAQPFLKSFALIVILLRAGLGISKKTLKQVGFTAFLMSFIPCLFEGIALLFLLHFFFEFSYLTAGLTAFMLSAVSPAVIVPSMLDIKAKGIGEKKQVPTIVLAGASVDDVFAITLFSVFLSLLTKTNLNITKSLMNIPLSIIMGIIPGIIIGFALIYYFKKRKDHIKTTEQTLVLLTISMLLVRVGDILHSAALLGIMTIGFIILEKADNIAHDLARKLAQIWIFAEIILFVLIGLSVDVKVAYNSGLIGLLVISLGLIARSIGVWLATAFSGLNRKERLFCIFAYLPKATVQAALGSVALNAGLAHGQTILALAVLAILFTAPLGLVLIRLFSKKLLED